MSMIQRRINKLNAERNALYRPANGVMSGKAFARINAISDELARLETMRRAMYAESQTVRGNYGW